MVADDDMNLPPPAERRPEARTRVLLGGVIVGDQGGFVESCRIRELTATGARVAISKHQRLPESVYLINVRDRLAYDALIKWRNRDEAGLLLRATTDLTKAIDPALAYLTRILNERIHMSSIWRS